MLKFIAMFLVPLFLFLGAGGGILLWMVLFPSISYTKEVDDQMMSGLFSGIVFYGAAIIIYNLYYWGKP